MSKATTLETVERERERERESYTLKTKSTVLFGKPETNIFIKNNLININKGNIILPCGFFDTG